MASKKDKIIEFEFSNNAYYFRSDTRKIGIPLKQIISKILPELRKEKKEFMKILEKNWGFMTGCEVSQIEAIFDYLKEKYEQRR